MIGCPRSANNGREQMQQRVVLFDYFVGAGEQRRRYVEAKRLRGLEVNHQLVLGGSLHRQVRRFLPLEDAVDVSGCLSELVNDIGPVRDQAPPALTLKLPA